jgi:transposase
MISIELDQEAQDILYNYIMTCTNERLGKKCLVIYLKGMGLSHKEIAKIVRVDQDTVTNYLKQYVQDGLEGLLEDNYRTPTGQLESYIPQLKKIFEQEPPHTVNHAIEIIFDLTGVRFKHSACRDFLKQIGLKRRRAGLVPGKALDDEKQREAQQEFHDNKLQPVLDEAKAGKRTVLFVDAAHFVMGAYLGFLWCFVRVLLPVCVDDNVIMFWELLIQLIMR